MLGHSFSQRELSQLEGRFFCPTLSLLVWDTDLTTGTPANMLGCETTWRKKTSSKRDGELKDKRNWVPEVHGDTKPTLDCQPLDFFYVRGMKP